MRHTAALCIALLASPSLAQLPPEEPLRVITGTQEEATALALCASPEAQPRPDGKAPNLYGYCQLLGMVQGPVVSQYMNEQAYRQAVDTVLREGQRLGLI